MAAPALAAVVLGVTWGRSLPTAVSLLVALPLIGAVLAAVHHAEVVALRVGEPFGSLVLAVAVTVIEVALIVTLMLSGGEDAATLARDTVFAAVMICLNGIVGLTLLVGALRHHLANFNPEGTGSALATVITLAGVTLVLPRFTTSEPGPRVHRRAARVRRGRLAGAVRHVRVHPDGPAPRLLPAGRIRRIRPGRRRTRRTAVEPRGHEVTSPAGPCARRRSSAWPRSSRSRSRDAVASAGLPHAFVGVIIALLVLAARVDRRGARRAS